MKLLRWNGSFHHCNTGSLRRHKLSAQCSVLPWNNYVIVKASSCWAFFQCFPSLLGKEKSAKCIYFEKGCWFIHPALIFATQSLIKSLQHITFALVCLTNVYEHSVLPAMKVALLIVRINLRSWSITTLILSSQRHWNGDFYIADF